MARKSPAFSFYPDSWVLGTLSMSFEEQGIYLRMLCFQWANGPQNATAYVNACGFRYEEQVNQILKSKFQFDGESYFNQRLEDERSKQEQFRGKQRENGAKGGRPKTQRITQTKPKNNPGLNPNETQTITQTKPKQNPSVSDSVSDSITDSDSQNTFVRFWQTYPRRTAKGAAERAWANAIKKAPAETIIEAAAVFAQSDKGRGEYCPHPATWLNGKCWEDDPAMWTNRTSLNGKVTIREQATKDAVNDWLRSKQQGGGVFEGVGRLGCDPGFSIDAGDS